MKNQKPPITIAQAEILFLAIKGIDTDIKALYQKFPNTPEGFNLFAEASKALRGKRKLLTAMYFVETGIDYE